MKKIYLNDKHPRMLLPTLNQINNNAYLTPCIKITIPNNTTVEISNRIFVDGPGGSLNESILNIPIGVLCFKLQSVGITVELYNNDMRYRNAALLQNFKSAVKVQRQVEESPTLLDQQFYETFITNLLATPQIPSISILSSTSSYDFKNNHFYADIGSYVDFEVKLSEAVINIQTYKVYNAEEIISDETTDGMIKNTVINKINELNKSLWQQRYNTLKV